MRCVCSHEETHTQRDSVTDGRWATQYLLRSLSRDECIKFWGQKIKVQGHGRITYARIITAQAEAYSTRRRVELDLLVLSLNQTKLHHAATFWSAESLRQFASVSSSGSISLNTVKNYQYNSKLYYMVYQMINLQLVFLAYYQLIYNGHILFSECTLGLLFTCFQLVHF